MVADPSRGQFGPPRGASRLIYPKSHSFRHEDPIGCCLSSATLIFTPIKSFLAFLTFCGNRLTFVCAAAAARATLPALRRLPTPGALRLRTCSRHALALALTACSFRFASAGVSTSGALDFNFIHLAMATQLWYIAAVRLPCPLPFSLAPTLRAGNVNAARQQWRQRRQEMHLQRFCDDFGSHIQGGNNADNVIHTRSLWKRLYSCCRLYSLYTLYSS